MGTERKTVPVLSYRHRKSTGVAAWIRDARGAYSREGTICCPGFHVFRGWVGCRAWAAGKPCTYCFLRSTFGEGRDPSLRKGVAWVDPWARGERQPERPTVLNARSAVEHWLDWGVEAAKQGMGARIIAQLLNAGELMDTLVWPPGQNPHVPMLLDVFSDPETNPSGHAILFLSKTGLDAAMAHLQGREPSPNVILSWSMGNLDAEPYWPGPFDKGGRLEAAGWAQSEGWRVRLRLDPMDSAENHTAECSPRDHAEAIADDWLPTAGPELITIGALRHHGGKQMHEPWLRAATYRGAIAGLRYGGYKGRIGLCKETPDVVRRIGLQDPGEMRCNCLP